MFSASAFLICAVSVEVENVEIEVVPVITIPYGLLFIIRSTFAEVALSIKEGPLANILKLYVLFGAKVALPIPPAENEVALDAMLSDNTENVEDVLSLYSILYPLTVVQVPVAAVHVKLAVFPQ
jgi:hypothetical protein